MKSFFFFLLSLIFLSIYILSSTDGLMKSISQYRFTTEGLLKSSRYCYGDLYGISFIPGFKKEIWKEDVLIKNDGCKSARSINLYSLCDSYLYSFVHTDSVFCGVRSYRYSKWGTSEPMEVNLDTSQVNVLLIELVERYFRITTQSNYIDRIKFIKPTAQVSKTKGVLAVMAAGLSLSLEEMMQIFRFIYNPMFNQNLEFNLFDYPVFTCFKESKAWINYKLFNRYPQEISILDDCHFLFLRETVDSTSDQSSFMYLSDEEVNDLVMRLNAVYRHYKANGFSEVVLTVMPNPVSVVSPDYKKYNDIIRRVQNHPGLIMPMINVYDKLRSANCQVYYNSDSHWNSNGFNLWLNDFNNYLGKFGKAGK